MKQIGLTKDVDFQAGVRKTLAVSTNTMWEFLLSEKGLEMCLGNVKIDDFIEGVKVKTSDGIEIKVRVFKPYSHIRMMWKKDNWPNETTLQIRIISAKQKTTISFHQEKLLDAVQREEMINHWKQVLQDLERIFKE